MLPSSGLPNFQVNFLHLLIFLLFIYLFIFAVRGPPTAVASPAVEHRLQTRRLSGHAHGPSRSAACGIFPDRGTNPCPLYRQADSQPLRHQGSPTLLDLQRSCQSAGEFHVGNVKMAGQSRASYSCEATFGIQGHLSSLQSGDQRRGDHKRRTHTREGFSYGHPCFKRENPVLYQELFLPNLEHHGLLFTSNLISSCILPLPGLTQLLSRAAGLENIRPPCLRAAGRAPAIAVLRLWPRGSYTRLPPGAQPLL